MSATRIVRKRLKRSGDAAHYYGEWIDKRPRDSYGHLKGYCSAMAAKRRKESEQAGKA